VSWEDRIGGDDGDQACGAKPGMWPCSPRAWFMFKRESHGEVPCSGELGHSLTATTCGHSRTWPCSPRAWFKFKRTPHAEVPRSGELGHILAATLQVFSSRGHARQEHGSSSSGSHTAKFRVLANSATALTATACSPVLMATKLSTEQILAEFPDLIERWR
jgi:hypothetical protein